MEQLGWTLIHFLWQGTLAAALCAICFAVARKSQWRYPVGLGGMALMAVSPIVTWFALGAGSSTGQRFEVPAIWPQAAPEGPVGDVSSPIAWVAWLPLIWACGASLLSTRVLAGWWLERRLVQSACPLPDGWAERLSMVAMASGVTQSWRAAVTERITVPQVSGILRPLLLLPASALTQIAPEQLEAILAHELAHIRRHDYLINLLQTAVECLLFYHPAVWWLSSRIREERELCCDAAAVDYCGDRATYAKALLALEESRPGLAMAASGGSLRDRVANLLEDRRPASFVLPVSAILLVAAGLTWAAQTEAPPPPAPASAPAAPSMIDGEPSTEIREKIEREIERTHREIERAKANMERKLKELQEAQAKMEIEGYQIDEKMARTQRDIARAMEKAHADMERQGPAIEKEMALAQKEMRRAMAQVQQAMLMQQDRMREEQLATPYNKWLREDVAYLVSDAERIAFLSLQTDAEREKFIEQFWERRGPKFKEEHYRRIAYANEKFADGRPGWRTDRGRVYISLGPPDEIESHPDRQTEEWKYNVGMSGTARLLQFRGKELRLTSMPPPPPPAPAMKIQRVPAPPPPPPAPKKD